MKYQRAIDSLGAAIGDLGFAADDPDLAQRECDSIRSLAERAAKLQARLYEEGLRPAPSLSRRG